MDNVNSHGFKKKSSVSINSSTVSKIKTSRAEKKEKVAKIQAIWNGLTSEHDNRLTEGYATF